MNLPGVVLGTPKGEGIIHYRYYSPLITNSNKTLTRNFYDISFLWLKPLYRASDYTWKITNMEFRNNLLPTTLIRKDSGAMVFL